nr:MAG TPA: hypothetical protein [Caudoviricetes sp.]
MFLTKSSRSSTRFYLYIFYLFIFYYFNRIVIEQWNQYNLNTRTTRV